MERRLEKSSDSCDPAALVVCSDSKIVMVFMSTQRFHVVLDNWNQAQWMRRAELQKLNYETHHQIYVSIKCVLNYLIESIAIHLSSFPPFHFSIRVKTFSELHSTQRAFVDLTFETERNLWNPSFEFWNKNKIKINKPIIVLTLHSSDHQVSLAEETRSMPKKTNSHLFRILFEAADICYIWYLSVYFTSTILC